MSAADDDRLSDYLRLREASLRRSPETAEGAFIAEGALIIQRAFDAGYVPRSFMLAPRWIDGLRQVLDASDAPCYIVSEAMAQQVTGFHVHRGALASFLRHEAWQLADVIDGATRLVVAEDIVDHTNVGAIIRSAAGLGWDGVLLSPRAADPLYRRSIKTSMGAVFSMPWARLPDWATGLSDLRDLGFTIVAMAPHENTITLTELAADPPARIALLVGTEGEGLSAHWLSQASTVVRIPMAHGVDSLNVAAATAIACYALKG